MSQRTVYTKDDDIRNLNAILTAVDTVSKRSFCEARASQSTTISTEILTYLHIHRSAAWSYKPQSISTTPVHAGAHSLPFNMPTYLDYVIKLFEHWRDQRPKETEPNIYITLVKQLKQAWFPEFRGASQSTTFHVQANWTQDMRRSLPVGPGTGTRIDINYSSRQGASGSFDPEKQSSASIISEEDLTTLLIKMKALYSETETQKNQIQQLQEEKEQLLNKMGTKMNAKVVSDETDIENIGVSVRPTTVADAYTYFRANHWLNANTALEQMQGKKSTMVTREQKINHYELLFNILMKAHSETERKVDELKRTVLLNLQNPLLAQSNSSMHSTLAGTQYNNHGNYSRSHAMSSSVEAEVTTLPPDLNMAILTFLRKNQIAQDQWNAAAKVILDKLNLHNYLYGSEQQLKDYTVEALKLCWNMAIQNPSMTFQKPMEYQENLLDLNYSSDSPAASSKKIKCFVFPCLYHGAKIVVKGEVILGR